MLSVVLIREILFFVRVANWPDTARCFTPVEHDVIVEHEIIVMDVVVLPPSGYSGTIKKAAKRLSIRYSSSLLETAAISSAVKIASL